MSWLSQLDYIFLIPLAVIVPFSALHLVFVLSICFLWTVRPDIALLNTFFWGLTSKIYRSELNFDQPNMVQSYQIRNNPQKEELEPLHTAVSESQRYYPF